MSVFDSNYAGHYDHLYATKDYGAECDLIEAAIARHGHGRPATVLDIGCGTGGHAIELARRNFRVTGVDLSASMLEHAQAKADAAALPIAPRWLCGDARHFDAGTHFDAAIMMFAVVGYLTGNDDVMAGLRNIRRHLAPGAPFLCDFWYGPSVLALRPADRVKVLEVPGGQVIRATGTTLDPVTHTADVSFRLWSIEGKSVVSETTELHRLRYFFPQEFAFMLAQAGFSLQSISAFPTLDCALDDQTWNAFVVARAV